MRKIVVLAALVTLAVPRHAFADITGFLGVNTTPSNRQTKGFAIGAGLLIVGLEFEYANTNEDLNTGAPSLTTGLGSVLLQTPVALGGFQPYFETGGGYYREELGARSDQGFALVKAGRFYDRLPRPVELAPGAYRVAVCNLDGKELSTRSVTVGSEPVVLEHAKLTERSCLAGQPARTHALSVSELAGPLRLRVDYRVLNLGSGALTSPAHRLYAGINLKF
jgi:hypothetical protein